MRIEILVGLENPVFYPINKSKTIIGSDLSCDIVVSEDQISRKHLIIQKEEENYFVIDQGSTNGSYLNEERLIPGRRVEFTSYFPVRLGSSVLVSLVSDEEALDEVNKISIPFPGESSAPKKNPISPAPKPREPEEKTTVVSLRDLQKSSTGTMVKRREAYKKKLAERAKGEADPKKVKKKGKKKKKKKFLELYEIIAIAIIGGAVYFTYIGEADKSHEALQSSAEKGPDETITATETAPKKKPEVPNFLELFELKTAPKCVSESEKILCSSLKLPEDGRWGAVEHKGQLIVLFDADPYFKNMQRRLPDAKTGDQKRNEELWRLTVGWFLLNAFNNDDYVKLENREIIFALFTEDQGIYKVSASFLVLPLDLQKLRRLTDAGRFNFVEVSRDQIVGYLDDYIELNL